MVPLHHHRQQPMKSGWQYTDGKHSARRKVEKWSDYATFKVSHAQNGSYVGESLSWCLKSTRVTHIIRIYVIHNVSEDYRCMIFAPALTHSFCSMTSTTPTPSPLQNNPLFVAVIIQMTPKIYIYPYQLHLHTYVY